MSLARPIQVFTQDPRAAVVLCAEEASRDVIAFWLSEASVRVHVPADGYEADRLLRDDSCRLLVTDRILPPWPGLRPFMRLRAANPDLRIAFLDSGNLDDRILARATIGATILPRPLQRQFVIEALPRPAAAI